MSAWSTRKGRNVLASTDDKPSQMLLNAIGGVLSSMRELQAVFASHFNSFRRFAPDSYAPTVPDWGLDNRGTSVRVPEFSGKGARIEHRVSGSDANPYLALAAVLGGMLLG